MEQSWSIIEWKQDSPCMRCGYHLVIPLQGTGLKNNKAAPCIGFETLSTLCDGFPLLVIRFILAGAKNVCTWSPIIWALILCQKKTRNSSKF